MPKKDEPVVDMRNMGFIHIQRQPQIPFQECSTLLTDGLGMCLCPFDDDHKVISITTVGNSGLPLTILSNGNGPPFLDAEVTASSHSPLPAGYVTLPVDSRSPPLGLMLFHSEKYGSFLHSKDMHPGYCRVEAHYT
jgi:hypothetical protein